MKGDSATPQDGDNRARDRIYGEDYAVEVDVPPRWQQDGDTTEPDDEQQKAFDAIVPLR